MTRTVRVALATMAAWPLTFAAGPADAQNASAALEAQLDTLALEVQYAEDLAAIKRLQRIYGYYLDKGLWEDLAALFTDDAVANYPAGVYIGLPSIRRHLFMNVGGGEMGQNGLREGRLYNHMNLQPVVHLDPGGRTAKGRWRAFAMFGGFGGGATWAEGIYEMGYVKEDGVWKIRTLDYHSGFGAPYTTGWSGGGAGAGGGGGRPPLPHPPDRVRDMPCEGFPAACVVPFHYDNPGTPAGGSVWTVPDDASSAGRPTTADARELAAELLHRATLLRDEQAVENLLEIYGYYVDRRMWDHVADLFADDGTIEMELRGVYVGRERIRQFLDLLGPQGLRDGDLNDRAHLQPVVHVAPDGQMAWARSRELGMTGVHGSHGTWSEGIYETSFVKEDDVWKFQSLRYYPTFISDYDEGWARDAQPPATVSSELPPDRPPTEIYQIYPQPHVPPFHYRNPVTGEVAHYPTGDGRPSNRAIQAALMPVERSGRRNAARNRAQVNDVDAALAEAERLVHRAKDYHELVNLTNAYGYYLDKNLWNDLADLFAEDGAIELAQRGAYHGRERVRGFLFAVFGDEGPVEGRLGNHLQMQPVVHIAPDGQKAEIRSRMMQQLSFSGRASMGASVYENEAVKENGVWKFSSVHTYNTWTASYEDGWAKTQSRGVPGQSQSYPPDAPPTLEFQMFPTVYQLPWHYRNPVSGRLSGPAPVRPSMIRTSAADSGRGADSGSGIPPHIAAALLAIGARIEGPQTAELYAPLHPPEPYSGVSYTRDLSYGAHERHVLDVFTSPGAGSGKPVVVFVHGGGFSRGAKSTPGSPFYDNVMRWAVSEGLVGVSINYRLAPDHPWPAGIEDVGAVVDWLHGNVERYGGDPEQIFLWGHSAGAAHAADYVAHQARQRRDARIAGAILTSGFYDLGDDVSVWEAYYGDDVSTYAERSSLPGLVMSDVPLFVNDAQLDPENFQIEAEKLTRARAEGGRPVRRLHLLGHSHISETYAIGTSDRSLSDPVLEFIHEVSGNGG